ncbi:MAG: P-II family nitrogen regulator [Actinomycetota bacterium]|nr:P-II family nitrogen regulator [Actinomycetota bacterium]
MTDFVVFAIGALAYWAIGFGLMFGGAHGIASLGGVAPLNGLFEIAKGWGIFGPKGMTVTDVKGAGKQRGYTEVYRADVAGKLPGC